MLVKEVLEFHSKEIKESKILKTLNVETDNYFVVSAHREENVDDKDSLNKLLDSLALCTLLSSFIEVPIF